LALTQQGKVETKQMTPFWKKNHKNNNISKM